MFERVVSVDSIRQLVDDFGSYLYLPRLRDSSVLLEAVRGTRLILSASGPDAARRWEGEGALVLGAGSIGSKSLCRD